MLRGRRSVKEGRRRGGVRVAVREEESGFFMSLQGRRQLLTGPG